MSAPESTPRKRTARKSMSRKATSRKATSRKKTGARKASSGAARKSTYVRKTTPLSKDLIARIKKLNKGGKTLGEIAKILNKEKKTTARGLPWTTQNVWHVVHRKG